MFATPILFPLSSLPCKVQEIIEQVHHELNYPVNYTAASMLLAAAVAIGNSKVLRVKSEWIVKPIFFMALIGEPGSLKTHPINFALKPFERTDAFTLSKYEKELDDYRHNALTEKREKPKARQHIIKDFTFESIERSLRQIPMVYVFMPTNSRDGLNLSTSTDQGEEIWNNGFPFLTGCLWWLIENHWMM